MTLMIDRKGFTLIELLIVVVIIGILAAIAIPKFSATREKAYYSAMKSDLKNLASQQEIYYSNGGYTYTTSLSDLSFSPSEGVDIADGYLTADESGWSATVGHEALTAEGCSIYYGDATAVNTPAGNTPEEAGQVYCDDNP